MKAKIIPFETAKAPNYNAAEEKNNNIVGKRLAAARKSRGLSLEGLRDRLDVYGVKTSRASIGKWETGETTPNAYQLLAVCAALGVEDRISALMSNYVPPLNEIGMRKVEEYKADLIASGNYKPAPKTQSVIRYIDMPVSNLQVSAGTGSFLDEGHFDIVSFPEASVPQGADFAVRVHGSSMEPVYHDGQIVWVQLCDKLEVGQVGVFIYDNEGFIKMYGEQEPEADVREDYTDSYGVVRPQPVLVSYNQEYKPKAVKPAAGFRIVGRVM